MDKYINMDIEILNVIHAVLDYKRFLQSYHVMMLGNKQYDTEKVAQNFYYNLENLPTGMQKNRADFNRILDYESCNRKRLKELDSKELSQLEHYVWKAL